MPNKSKDDKDVLYPPEDQSDVRDGVQPEPVQVPDPNDPSAILTVDQKLAIEADQAKEDKLRADLAPDDKTVAATVASIPPKGPDGHVPRPAGAIHIRVLHTYRGRKTKEQVIEPGVYVETDYRLFGLAEYLCDNGQAIWITTT